LLALKFENDFHLLQFFSIRILIQIFFARTILRKLYKCVQILFYINDSLVFGIYILLSAFMGHSA